MTTEKQKIEKGISDIVGALTDPIIVFPGGWGDTLPGWLKNAITLERLVMNIKALKGEEMTGTDAEACAYIYTASLTQPMDHDWTQIYLYVATKTYEKWRTKERGVETPADIRVESLRDDQLADLNRLKDWIYRQRTKIRLERDRAERRQKKEEAKAQRKAEQPALFEFKSNQRYRKGGWGFISSQPPFLFLIAHMSFCYLSRLLTFLGRRFIVHT